MNDHALRRGLDDWFDQAGITPKVIAEFDDSALLKAFGQAGKGVLPAPSVIEAEVTADGWLSDERMSPNGATQLKAGQDTVVVSDLRIYNTRSKTLRELNKSS